MATQGQAAMTYFYGMEVAPYNPEIGVMEKKDIEHREYDSCLLPKTIKERE